MTGWRLHDRDCFWLETGLACTLAGAAMAVAGLALAKVEKNPVFYALDGVGLLVGVGGVTAGTSSGLSVASPFKIQLEREGHQL